MSRVLFVSPDLSQDAEAEPAEAEEANKSRRAESKDQRSERLEQSARRAIVDATAAEDALDEMVRRSIRLHGA